MANAEPIMEDLLDYRFMEGQLGRSEFWEFIPGGAERYLSIF